MSRAATRAAPRRAGRGGPVVRVLGSASNETTAALVRAWRALGIDAALLAAGDAGSARTGVDVVLGRLDVLRTLDGVEAGLLGLLRLEWWGVPVLNPASALVAVHDKLRTAVLLRRAGLPHPRTAHLRGAGPVPLAPPLVLKPRFGSWGRDVFLCRDGADVARTIAAVGDRPWFRRHGALVQALVPPAGRDLRIVVAGGEVVGASERVARPGEWRTNVSLGGSLRPVEPPPGSRSLAVAAAVAVGADLVGVDLVPLASGGHVVLELNGAVDFDERYSLHDGDVYAEAARALGLSARPPGACGKAEPGSGCGPMPGDAARRTLHVGAR
jgi:[lysine-biosynthesis-protein LysW]--L-2-aminoadipate ligase